MDLPRVGGHLIVGAMGTGAQSPSRGPEEVRRIMSERLDSPNRLNRLKDLWIAGKPSFGAIITMPSVQVIQVLAGAGFDWFIIDMEHGPIDLPSAHALIVATAGTPAVPFVRVSWTIPYLAKAVLDFGALGVCYPMIRSRAEAEVAARSVRYPPEGERLWGPFYAPLRWNLPMVEYMRAANKDVLAIITIEHRRPSKTSTRSSVPRALTWRSSARAISPRV